MMGSRITAMAIGVAALALAGTTALAETEWAVLPHVEMDTEPGLMVKTYLLDKAEEAYGARRERFEAMETAEDVEARQERMRAFFWEQLGGELERTPLNSQVVDTLERDGYTVKKILFESQPKHYVTGVLYLPDADPPYPGVLVPCGHSAQGKARDLYQRAPILMAKSGVAAFCYDPIDQGERRQLLDDEGEPVITQATRGHYHTGVGSILVGRNTATYRIWDGIRAIDYLESRADIDSGRIGCAGISGGGTLTSYLMALDERISAAAPGCYLTSFQRLLETIGPQDAEQNIFGQIAFGMDHADYVIMAAPRPTLVMAATEDYFDIEGTWDGFREAARVYGLLECPERTAIMEAPGGHGFPMLMREAAANWMRRWLLDKDEPITEPDFPIAEEEDLWCTPDGEVMRLPGARSVYDLNWEVEERLAEERAAFWDGTPVDEALEEVRRITGIRTRDELPELEWELVSQEPREGYRVDKLVLRPEPGIWLPALAFVPDEDGGEAYVYLHEDGKEAGVSRIRELVSEGHMALAVDLRGIGETRPGGDHSYTGYLPAEWRDATIAYLLGTSLLAMRAEEIILCAGLAAEYESGEPRPVHLISVGRVGPPALHAAALEPDRFASASFRRGLVSWSNVVATPLSQNQDANLVHGALKTYDLPDLLRAMPEDQVEFTEPLDAAGEPTEGTQGMAP